MNFKMAAITGYRNGTNLTILNLHVAPISPTKFSSTRLSAWEKMSVKEFLDGRPSLILKRNDFSNSKSTCCPNNSFQVSVQTDLRFLRRCRKCEKLTTDDGRRTDDGRADDGRRIAGNGIRLSGASNSP